jgi:2-dehydropantoate 2-reductase
MRNGAMDFTIVIYGAGAIGCCIGGWLTTHYQNIYFLARGENAQILKSIGLILYHKERDNTKPLRVNVIEELNELSSVDIVIIAVKNYNLEEVAKDIFSKLGDKPVIIALQNGVENQKVLPKYFSKILYGVVMISAWRDEPGVFGYMEKGYIVIGALDDSFQSEIREIKNILKIGVLIKISKKIQDAVHTKLIYNLSNATLTLIDYRNIQNSSIPKLRKIIYNSMLEGIKIVKAKGYNEHRLPGILSWKSIESAAIEDNETANKMVMTQINTPGPNSMEQDKILRRKSESELEYLNGYIIHLADSLGMKAQYNRVIYELSKKNFQKKPYQSLDVEVVWKKIIENIST